MNPSGGVSSDEEFHFNNPSLKESLQILIDSNQICAKLKNLYREDSTLLNKKCQNEIVGKRSFLDLRKQEQYDVENLLFLLQQKLDILLIHMKNADDYNQNKEKLKRHLIQTIDGYKKLLGNIKNVLRQDSINTGVDYFKSYGSLYSLNDKPEEIENTNEDIEKISNICKFADIDQNLYKVVDECLNHYKNLDQKYKESLDTILQDKVDNGTMESLKKELTDLNNNYYGLQQKYEEQSKALKQLPAIHQEKLNELNQNLNLITRENERQKAELTEMSAQIDDFVAHNQSSLDMEPRSMTDFMKQPLPSKVNFLTEQFKSLFNSNIELQSTKQGAVQTVKHASQMLEGVLIDHYSAKSSKSHKSTSTIDLPGLKSKKLKEKFEQKKRSGFKNMGKKASAVDTSLSLSGTLFQPSLKEEGVHILSDKCSQTSVKSKECPSQENFDSGNDKDFELFIRLVRETSLIDKVIALVRILDYLITDLKNTKKRAKQKILRAHIEAKRASMSSSNDYKMLQKQYELLKRYVYDQQTTISNLLRAKGEMDRRVSLWIDALKQENMPREIRSILQIQSEFSTTVGKGNVDNSQEQPSLDQIDDSHFKNDATKSEAPKYKPNILKDDEKAEQKYHEFVESLKKNSIIAPSSTRSNGEKNENYSAKDRYNRILSDSGLLNITQDSDLSKSQSFDFNNVSRLNKLSLTSAILSANKNFSRHLADDAAENRSAKQISQELTKPKALFPIIRRLDGLICNEDVASPKLESVSKVSFVDFHPYMANQWTTRASNRHFDPTRISTPTKYIPPEFLDLKTSAFSDTQDTSSYPSPLKGSSGLRKSQKSSDYFSLSQSQNTTESLFSDMKHTDSTRKLSNRKKSSIPISKKLQRKALGPFNKKQSLLSHEEDDPSSYYTLFSQPLVDQSLDLATTTTHGTSGHDTHSFRDNKPVPLLSSAKTDRLATKKASSSYLYDLVLELSPSLSIIPADTSTPLIASDQQSPAKLKMLKQTPDGTIKSDHSSCIDINISQNKLPRQKALVSLQKKQHTKQPNHSDLNDGFHDHGQPGTAKECHCCLEYPEIRKILNLTLFPACDEVTEDKENENDDDNTTLPDGSRRINKVDLENYKGLVESILAKHIANRHITQDKNTEN